MMGESRKDKYHAGMIEGVRLALQLLQHLDDDVIQDAELIFQKERVERWCSKIAEEGDYQCPFQYAAGESSLRTLGAIRRMLFQLHSGLGGKGEKWPLLSREDLSPFPATKKSTMEVDDE